MAIAIDGSAASSAVAAASSVTFAVSVTSSGEELTVQIGARDAKPSTDTTVSTVTHNGDTVSFVVGATNTAPDPDTFRARAEIWKRESPDTGSTNVVVTWGGAVTYGAAAAASWTGVDQASPTDATGTNTGIATTLTCAITTVAANAYIVDAVYTRSGTLTKNASQTQIANTSLSGDDVFGSTYKDAGAAGVKSMDYTESADGNDWVIVAMSLKPSTTSIKDLIGSGFIPFAR